LKVKLSKIWFWEWSEHSFWVNF